MDEKERDVKEKWERQYNILHPRPCGTQVIGTGENGIPLAFVDKGRLFDTGKADLIGSYNDEQHQLTWNLYSGRTERFLVVVPHPDHPGGRHPTDKSRRIPMRPSLRRFASHHDCVEWTAARLGRSGLDAIAFIWDCA